MDFEVETYNLAVGYLKDELFDEAITLLERLVAEEANFHQAKWALGIAYTLSGFPVKALDTWRSITQSYDQELFEAIHSVEQKLPLYREIYDCYNQALKHIQNSEYHEASQLFDQILRWRWDVPIPVQCYQGYLLTKMIIGEEKQAFEAMITLPAYVRKSLVIQDLGEEIHQFLQEYRNRKELFTEKAIRKSKIVVYMNSLFQNMMNGLKN